VTDRPFYGDDFTPKPDIPEPDTEAAVRFLKRWCPEGPWVLTSIVPDGKTTTQTFAADSWRDAAAWISDRQTKENIYFHVNPTLRPLTNKASKEDMARLAWLHVDVDPRAGEDIAAERERALKLLDWSRQDLLYAIKGLEQQKLNETYDGERWSINGILKHISGAEWWYQERIGSPFPAREEDLPEDPVESLELVRAHLASFLPQLVNVRRTVDEEGELWSPRKMLRRAAWHERDHTEHIHKLL